MVFFISLPTIEPSKGHLVATTFGDEVFYKEAWPTTANGALVNKSGKDAREAVDALIPQRKNIKWLTSFQQNYVRVLGDDCPLPHTLENYDWLCFPKWGDDDIDSDDYETDSDESESDSDESIEEESSESL